MLENEESTSSNEKTFTKLVENEMFELEKKIIQITMSVEYIFQINKK